MVRFCDLPEEVLEEIMSWLPPESLKQFKLVCKSWHANINGLINDAEFVAKHLRNMKHNLLSSPRLHFGNLFTGEGSLRETYLLTMANCDFDFSDYIPCLDDDFRLVTLALPHDCFKLVSHCDGIICFSMNVGHVFLLNSALGEFKAVHRSRFCVGFLVLGVGFGYDSRANDYKVVTVNFTFEYYSRTGTYKAEVYSLNSDSWKEIELDAEIIGFPIDEHQSVYCNGVCYWHYLDRAHVIISFDVSEEIFRRVPFPDNEVMEFRKWHPKGDRFEGKELWKMAVWNECLALFRYPELDPFFIDVWVMDGCFGGVEGSCSWTKHLTIGPVVNINQPIAFWDNKKLLMETKGGGLISYNTRTHELDLLENHSLYMLFSSSHLLIHVKSLVSVFKKKKEKEINSS